MDDEISYMGVARTSDQGLLSQKIVPLESPGLQINIRHLLLLMAPVSSVFSKTKRFFYRSNTLRIAPPKR